MIELLIVIGILGILAVGLLAAVDPFEQLKKARDNNDRQAAVSLHTAFTRYFATHGSLPWNNSNDTSGCYDVGGTPFEDGGVNLDDERLADCVLLLENDGELKPGFISAVGGTSGSMYVNSESTAAVSVCFPPQSKSVLAEDTTKFDQNGNDISTGEGAACIPGSTKVVNNCYYCAK